MAEELGMQRQDGIRRQVMVCVAELLGEKGMISGEEELALRAVMEQPTSRREER